MRTYYLAIIFLISCSTPKDSKKTESTDKVKAQEDSLKEAVAYIDFDKPSNCQYEFYLTHDSVSKEAKEFWNDERTPSDDAATIKVFSELNTKPEEVLPFYFLVAHKLLKEADGALTEITLEAVYKFVFEEHSKEYFSYANLEHCMISNRNFYYYNWAYQLGISLSIRCDNEDKFNEENYQNCIANKFIEMKKKCPECNVEELQEQTKRWL